MDQSEVRILVVDDVQAMRTQVADLLLSVGFKSIQLASNIQEAKQHLSKSPYQLILCDWHLNQGDGPELLDHIQKERLDSGCAFIMLTAEATKELVLQALKSGVDDYILKPMNQANLSKIYKVLLRKQIL
ncbi:MAG: response regulator [Oligoflexia bacterium]|nr:response regulator [Oligoflexia bacterium]